MVHSSGDHLIAGQHQFFKVVSNNGQRIFKVYGLLEFVFSRVANPIPNQLLTGNREQTRQGHQIEMGIQLLSYTAFVLAVKFINDDKLLGDFVQFFNLPSPVVQVCQILVADVPGLGQCGGQQIAVAFQGLADHAHRYCLTGLAWVTGHQLVPD